MRRMMLTLVMCGVALLCASARGDDWKQWGHDERRTQFSKDRIKLPLTELRSWTPLTGGSPLYGAAIADGRIYYINDTGIKKETRSDTPFAGRVTSVRFHASRALVCANAKTGQLIWKQPLEAVQLESPMSNIVAPVIDGGRVFVYDIRTVFHLYKIDATVSAGPGIGFGGPLKGALSYEEIFQYLTTLGNTDAAAARELTRMVDFIAMQLEGEPFSGNIDLTRPPKYAKAGGELQGSFDYSTEFPPLDVALRQAQEAKKSGNPLAAVTYRKLKVGIAPKPTLVLRVFAAADGAPGPEHIMRKGRITRPTPELTLRDVPLRDQYTQYTTTGVRAELHNSFSEELGPPLAQNGGITAATSSDRLLHWTPSPDKRTEQFAMVGILHPTGPSTLFPTHFSGYPVVQGPAGYVVGTDAYHRFLTHTGALSQLATWHQDLHCTVGNAAASTSAVFVPIGGTGAQLGIAAVQADNGALTWQYPPGAFITDPPSAPRGDLEKKIKASFWRNPGVALGKGCVYGEANGDIVALDQISGAPKWRHALPAGYGVRSLAASPNHLFLCISPVENLRQALWDEKLHHGALLIALDIDTGKLAWGERVPRAGGLALAGGLLYFMDGGMHVYGPAERTFHMAVNSADRGDYLVTQPAMDPKDEPKDESGLQAEVGTDAEPAPDNAMPGDANVEASRAEAAARAAAEAEKLRRVVGDATFLRLRYDEPREIQLARLRQRREGLPGVPLLLSLERLDATRAHWVDAAAYPPFSEAWTAEYVNTCRELAAAARPEHFEVLPEINVYLVQNPKRFPEILALAALLRQAVHQASPQTQVVFSFNAEVLSGRYARGDYRPFDQLPQPLKADVGMAVELAGLADEVGLTTVPQAAFVQAADFGWDYLPSFRPLFGDKPLLLTRVAVRLDEKQSVGALEQARFLRRVFHNSYWQGFSVVCYPDLTTEVGGPGGSPVALRLPETERLALGVWKDVLHWQLRGKLTVSLIEQPVEEEKPLE